MTNPPTRRMGRAEASEAEPFVTVEAASEARASARAETPEPPAQAAGDTRRAGGLLQQAETQNTAHPTY